jgi:hypothetical protein
MKIVQSLWTKPSLKKVNLNNFDRNMGGWSKRQYNYMSWALSCLRFREHYDEVELITDELGAEMLIGKLNLPYTRVRTELDQLNHYHPDLWALGKIYAYSVQDAPFLHADGDVYIWSKFEERIETAPLAAQNEEVNFPCYAEAFKELETKFHFLPNAVHWDREVNKGFTGINAGVLGGNRVDLINHYAREAFKFIDNNVDFLSSINIGNFNIVFEQYLFYCITQQQGQPIEYCFHQVNDRFDGLAEFSGIPNKVRYVHPIGLYKRRQEIGEHVANRLRLEFPEYYFKIMNLLNTYEL